MANSETSRGLVHRIELQPTGWRRRRGRAPVHGEAIRARGWGRLWRFGGEVNRQRLGNPQWGDCGCPALHRTRFLVKRFKRYVELALCRLGAIRGAVACLGGGKVKDRRGRGVAATRRVHVPHQLARRCLRRRHSGMTDLVVEPRPRRLVIANTMERSRAAFSRTRSKSYVHVNSWVGQQTDGPLGSLQRCPPRVNLSGNRFRAPRRVRDWLSRATTVAAQTGSEGEVRDLWAKPRSCSVGRRHA